MQEAWIQSPCWKDPLEKEMATHSNTLAGEIAWTEEPGGLQDMTERLRTHAPTQRMLTSPVPYKNSGDWIWNEFSWQITFHRYIPNELLLCESTRKKKLEACPWFPIVFTLYAFSLCRFCKFSSIPFYTVMWKIMFVISTVCWVLLVFLVNGWTWGGFGKLLI